MSLSERFAKIQTIKTVVRPSRAAKINNALDSKKDKRNVIIQAKRGLTVKPAVKRISKPTKVTGKRIPNKKSAIKNGKFKGKGKGRGRFGKGNKKGPIKAEDLDKEIGSYWHKAGKGPDPNQVELDDELERYKAQKGSA